MFDKHFDIQSEVLKKKNTAVMVRSLQASCSEAPPTEIRFDGDCEDSLFFML